ncbi:hypothetical protein DFH27DRAFT_604551 [Peziza echinospora]|nr:hypothetical protein DFH27DRAFT_604551 [Peziza echinospora]
MAAINAVFQRHDTDLQGIPSYVFSRVNASTRRFNVWGRVHLSTTHAPTLGLVLQATCPATIRHKTKQLSHPHISQYQVLVTLTESSDLTVTVRLEPFDALRQELGRLAATSSKRTPAARCTESQLQALTEGFSRAMGPLSKDTQLEIVAHFMTAMKTTAAAAQEKHGKADPATLAAREIKMEKDTEPAPPTKDIAPRQRSPPAAKLPRPDNTGATEAEMAQHVLHLLAYEELHLARDRAREELEAMGANLFSLTTVKGIRHLLKMKEADWAFLRNIAKELPLVEGKINVDVAMRMKHILAELYALSSTPSNSSSALTIHAKTLIHRFLCGEDRKLFSLHLSAALFSAATALLWDSMLRAKLREKEDVPADQAPAKLPSKRHGRSGGERKQTGGANDAVEM